MAESAEPQAMEYRCRRCRQKLGISEAVIHKFDDCLVVIATEYSGELFLDVEKCPYWINREVEKASFTKGKLSCLKCEGRLGSFDFLKRNRCSCGNHELPPLHLLCNRIDHVPVRTSPHPKVKQLWKELKSKPSDEGSSLGGSCSGPTADINTGERAQGSDGSGTSSAVIVGNVDTTRRDIVRRLSRETTPAEARSGRYPGDGAGIVNDDEEAFRVETSNRFSKLQHSETSIDEPEEPDIPEEPDNPADTAASFLLGNDVPADVTCVICYDLLYKPHRCAPCGHVYCGSCLQMLARDKPNRTLCPLCRATIIRCVPLQEMDDELKTLYSGAHMQRASQVRKLKVSSFRLPSVASSDVRRFVPARSHRLVSLLRRIATRYMLIFFVAFVNGVLSFYMEAPFPAAFESTSSKSSGMLPFSSYLTHLCAKLFLVSVMYVVRRLKREIFGARTIKLGMYLFMYLTCKDDETWMRFIFSLYLLGSLVWLS